MACPKKYLYHLSYEPRLRVLKPRKIVSAAMGEPDLERICFSKTIQGCFIAVETNMISRYETNCYEQKLYKKRRYLYRTKEPVLYKLPYSVMDSKITQEVWRLEDTEVELYCEFDENYLMAFPCTSRGLADTSQREEAKTIKNMFKYSKALIRKPSEKDFIIINLYELGDLNS